MNKTLIALFSLIIFSFKIYASENIYVVVNKNNPIETLEKEQIRDLYLGRKQIFPNGDYAIILDHEKSNLTRQKFFRHIANMRLNQIDAYWARLIFSGSIQPLEIMADENQLSETIQSTNNAIGYLSNKPTNKYLKVVYVIHTKR